MMPLGFIFLVGGTLLFAYLLAAAVKPSAPKDPANSSAKPRIRYYALLGLALVLVLAGYGILKTRGYW